MIQLNLSRADVEQREPAECFTEEVQFTCTNSAHLLQVRVAIAFSTQFSYCRGHNSDHLSLLISNKSLFPLGGSVDSQVLRMTCQRLKITTPLLLLRGSH